MVEASALTIAAVQLPVRGYGDRFEVEGQTSPRHWERMAREPDLLKRDALPSHRYSAELERQAVESRRERGDLEWNADPLGRDSVWFALYSCEFLRYDRTVVRQRRELLR